MPLATDSLNPKFVFFSPVETPVRDCHDLAAHVDHAIIAFDGRAPFAGDCAIELVEQPVDGLVERLPLLARGGGCGLVELGEDVSCSVDQVGGGCGH